MKLFISIKQVALIVFSFATIAISSTSANASVCSGARPFCYHWYSEKTYWCCDSEKKSSCIKQNDACSNLKQ